MPLTLTRLNHQLGKPLEWPVPSTRRIAAVHRSMDVLTAASSLRSQSRSTKSRAARLMLPEQPFDALLLQLSPLYRNSRELYLKSGAKFRACLVSSQRTLSSPILLDPMIEFSPVESELIWSVRDPIQRKSTQHLEGVLKIVTNVFHEQNHRLLWRLLPPPPAPGKSGALRRFQNFAESLVVATDMALGDELGQRMAAACTLLGVTYDPGTPVRAEGLSRRQYRNYLHALVLGTYLTLEMYSIDLVGRVLQTQFPGLGPLAERAARRSVKLDHQFVAITNPVWQEKYSRLLHKKLSRRKEAPLQLSDNPADGHQLYLIAEKWFEFIGL